MQYFSILPIYEYVFGLSPSPIKSYSVLSVAIVLTGLYQEVKALNS